jgi:hypothetical protein
MAKVRGTNKSETLNGLTDDDDTIAGRGGSDVVNALGGRDIISAGDGADTVFGGGGDDLIYGHSQTDLSQGSGFIRARKIADIGPDAVQTAVTDADPGFIYALAKEEGVIYRINEETGKTKEFLDIPNSQFSGGGERGVLGMAFHPDYENNGRLFVYLTNPDGDIEIQEYGPENPNSSQLEFKQSVITIAHPDFDNHNGGSIVFGPDGMLYLGIGDGGDQGDPSGNAQDLDKLLGKILRIDVDEDAFPGNSNKNYAIPGACPLIPKPATSISVMSGKAGLKRSTTFRRTRRVASISVGITSKATNLMKARRRMALPSSIRFSNIRMMGPVLQSRADSSIMAQHQG